MKPPQEGRNTGAPSLRGLQGRSATGLNGQAAKEEVSALWQEGWMPENISGVPAGRSVFRLTSPSSRTCQITPVESIEASPSSWPSVTPAQAQSTAFIGPLGYEPTG